MQEVGPSDPTGTMAGTARALEEYWIAAEGVQRCACGKKPPSRPALAVARLRQPEQLQLQTVKVKTTPAHWAEVRGSAAAFAEGAGVERRIPSAP